MARMHYSRSIQLDNRGRATHVELDDDFHHFTLVLQHDGERIVALQGASSRTPWSTCVGAPTVLDALVGQRLGAGSPRLTPAEQGEQCVHLLDMVALAAVHALRAAATRRYDIDVVRGERPKDPIDATFRRDGAVLHAWRFDATALNAPPPYNGFPRQAVGQLAPDLVQAWCRDQQFDADATEALLALHRGLYVSGARYYDWDTPLTSAEREVPHFCYTHSAARAASAHTTPSLFKPVRLHRPTGAR
jgi:Protein of unknown function (DUF2889)